MRFSAADFLKHHLPMILLAALCAPPGCSGGPDDHDADHDDHIGHVLPAHKPNTFAEAVPTLRRLNEALPQAGEGSGGSHGPAEILLDIARWLPEIAADSDMTEPLWNRVDQASTRLAAVYESATNKRTAPREASLAAAPLIGELDRVLAECDPSWFTTKPTAAGASAPADKVHVNK